MMRAELACFVLFHIIRVASAEDENSINEQISSVTIFNQLFGSDGEPLSVEETLHSLKQLATSSGLDIQKIHMVNDLIEMSALSQSKCSVATFKLFESKVKECGGAKANILPFLKHWKLKQFKICKGVYKKRLLNHQSYLTDQKLKNLKTLRMWTVYYPSTNYFVDDEHQLIEGLVQYYQFQAGDNLHHKPPKDYTYKWEIIELGRTCEWVRVSEDLKKETEQFKKILLGDESLIKSTDRFLLDWIASVRICEAIENNFAKYSTSIVETIGKRRNKHN